MTYARAINRPRAFAPHGFSLDTIHFIAGYPYHFPPLTPVPRRAPAPMLSLQDARARHFISYFERLDAGPGEYAGRVMLLFSLDANTYARAHITEKAPIILPSALFLHDAALLLAISCRRVRKAISFSSIDDSRVAGGHSMPIFSLYYDASRSPRQFLAKSPPY